MKDLFRLIFLNLIVIYTILIFAVNTDLLWKYSIQFNLLAIIIGILGIFSLEYKTHNLKMKYVYLIFIATAVFAIFMRTIPYWNNSIPLGYDTGIYKYIFEQFQHALPNIPEYGLDSWIRAGFPSGLPILMDIFFVFDFSTQTLLTYLLILLSSFLIFPLYMVVKKYFGKEAGAISILLYAFSFTQFQTFAFMYYKNVVAMGLMLFAIYFIDKNDRQSLALTALFATAIGFIHRPTFLMFIFVWIAYIIVNFKNKQLIKKHITAMIITGFFLSIIYTPRFNEIILAPLESVFGSMVAPGTIGSGTFFSFFKYQFVSLVYLPFAVLGFLYLIIKRKFSNPIFLWFAVNSVIVIFKIMFFNRFIIHLDIVFILTASVGIVYGIINSTDKRIALGIISLLLLSSGFTTYNLASSTHPLLNSKQLNSIMKIQNLTEKNAYIMATSSYYSPWILGYSKRKTIAPGLFDYDKWNYEQWIKFWKAGNITEIKDLMGVYNKPLYIFIGKHGSTNFNLNKFSGSCFKTVLNDNGGILYNYRC